MKTFFDRVLLFDGSMGALLGQMGYDAACADEMTVTHPEVIRGIHEKYIASGADVVISDSFGSTEMALAHKKRAGRGAEFARRAVEIAREAAGTKALVAADFGPTSEFMYPVGEKPMQAFYDTFHAQAMAIRDAGADFAIIETQTDAAECRAACLAIRDAGLPVAASFSIASNGRTLTGSSPECCALMLEGVGAMALGLNCSSGPREMIAPLKKMRAVTALPIITQPNAGLPQTAPDGSVFYPFGPDVFAEAVRPLLDAGASAIGGCCGTTPAHIAALRPLAGGALPASENEEENYICSMRSFITLEEALSAVEELDDPEDAYDLDEDSTLGLLNLTGLSPEEAAEAAVLAASATRTPLGFRAGSTDLEALEAALRAYPGIAAVDAPASASEILARYGAKRM